jgi:hypothetical protein
MDSIVNSLKSEGEASLRDGRFRLDTQQFLQPLKKLLNSHPYLPCQVLVQAAVVADAHEVSLTWGRSGLTAQFGGVEMDAQRLKQALQKDRLEDPLSGLLARLVWLSAAGGSDFELVLRGSSGGLCITGKGEAWKVEDVPIHATGELV